MHPTSLRMFWKTFVEKLPKAARIEHEYNLGWVDNNPILYLKSLFKDQEQYGSDYVVTLDNTRAGYVTYVYNKRDDNA